MNHLGVAICTPSRGEVSSEYCFSLAKMMNFVNKKRIPGYDVQYFGNMIVNTSTIHGTRDMMCNVVVNNEQMTHILFIDDDMCFEPDIIHTMLEKEEPIVACNYRRRIPPAEFVASRSPGNIIQTTEDSSGLEEAWLTGFGFCLMHREVLEAVQEPRFMMRWDPSGGYTTEEICFFDKARAAGYKLMIDHDASKKLFHVGKMYYIWNKDYTQFSDIM